MDEFRKLLSEYLDENESNLNTDELAGVKDFELWVKIHKQKGFASDWLVVGDDRIVSTSLGQICVITARLPQSKATLIRKVISAVPEMIELIERLAAGNPFTQKDQNLLEMLRGN